MVRNKMVNVFFKRNGFSCSNVGGYEHR